MPDPVSFHDVAALDGLDEWRFVSRALHADYGAGSFGAAAALATAIAHAADDAVHHPDLEIRYPDRVRVSLTTHEIGGVSDLDVALAREISAIAAASGATSLPPAAQFVEVAINTADPDRIRPFWQAVTGAREVDGRLVDPLRAGPTIWFQRVGRPAAGDGRVHLDLYVAADVLRGRLDAALAAGGTLVTDAFAPTWFVLADPEGNEVCLSISDDQ